MKKQWSKIIAMSLVCAITLPTTVFGGTAPTLSGNNPNTVSAGGIVVGEGDVDSATYNVMIPLNMNFAIDTFEIADKSQIYGVDYPVINASVFPVKVEVSVSGNIPSGVSANYVTSPTDTALSTGVAKAAYLTAYIPDSVDVTATVSSGAVSSNTVSGSYLPVSANNVIVATDTAPANFAFKLNSYVPGADIAQDNIATFTFNGKVNPNAAWAKGDIKVIGTFTFSGLPKADYNALQSNSANNIITGSGGGSSSTNTKTYHRAAPANVIFDITPPSGGTSVSSVTAVGTGSNNAVKTPGFGTYANGKYTLTGTAGALANPISNNGWPLDTYTFTLTFNTGGTATCTLVLAN